MTAASADAATAHVHLCRGPDDSTAWSNGYRLDSKRSVRPWNGGRTGVVGVR